MYTSCTSYTRTSSGVSSIGSLTPDMEGINIRDSRPSLDSGHGSSFEDEIFPNRNSISSDRGKLVNDPGWKGRRSMLGSFGSGSLEDDSIEAPKQESLEKKRKLERSKIIDLTVHGDT